MYQRFTKSNIYPQKLQSDPGTLPNTKKGTLTLFNKQ